MNKKQSAPVKPPPSTDRILEKVRGAGLPEKELVALHHNALRLQALDVVEAVEIRLRADFPRAAKKLYGDKKPAVAAPSAIAPVDVVLAAPVAEAGH